MCYAAQTVTGPFGLDAAKGQTVSYQRTVLVVVHHVTAATRLAEIVPLLEADRRVQVVFTWAPASVFCSGVQDYLARLGGVVVPWQQATQVRFDLAVAAAYGLLERVHAPVMTMSHGVGFGKYMSRWDGAGPAGAREGAGAVRARLVYHGRVVPSAVMVGTGAHLAHLRRSCPEAAPVAVVAGDPCYDKLAASLRWRHAYREALGVGDRRKLVVVSSTWGPGSLLREHPGLLPRLATELRRTGYEVAAVLHPNIWYWHGPRQVRAWYGGLDRRETFLVPPEDDWRPVLAAADCVIGDHGSVTCYAASIGVPVLLGCFARGEVEPGSPPATLAAAARRLRMDRPVAPQLDDAVATWPKRLREEMTAQITSEPGRSARIICATMHRLMNLPEPDAALREQPAPVPGPLADLDTCGSAR